MSSIDLIGAVPRVDLMPARAREARARKATVATWAWVAFGAVIVAAVAVLAAFAYQLFASGELFAEQSRTQNLLVETSQYQDVSVLQSEKNQTEALLSTALAGDLEWGALLSQATAALPAGTRLTGYTLSTPGADTSQGGASEASGATDETAALPGGAETTPIGPSGTLSFEADNAGLQAQTVAALRALPSVVFADAGTLTAGGDSGATFDVTVIFDQSSYTGRFGTTTGAGAGQ